MVLFKLIYVLKVVCLYLEREAEFERVALASLQFVAVLQHQKVCPTWL